MRETEFDAVRWVIYGIILLALAVASFAAPILLWAFAVILTIAIIDILYARFFKGKVWRS